MKRGKAFAETDAGSCISPQEKYIAGTLIAFHFAPEGEHVMDSAYSDLLCELIRLRPVTADVPAVNRVSAALRAFLERRGVACRTETIQGRDVLYASTSDGEPDVLFNAHMDVVPAAPEQFEPRIESGVLYGRGAVDCLGNCVCIAKILCSLNGRASAGAVFSADEETGGATTGEMARRGFGAKRFVVLLDSHNDWSIVARQKGALGVRLIARGPGGHGAYPWRCENPIDVLLDGYRRFRDAWKNPASESEWGDSMAACMIQAGTANNQIPGEASLWLDFRCVDDSRKEAILDSLKRTTGLEVETIKSIPAVFNDVDDPEMKRLRDVFARRFPERTIGFVDLCGATDSVHWIKLGVPVAVVGVRGDGLHSACEWVDLDSIDAYASALEEFAAT